MAHKCKKPSPMLKGVGYEWSCPECGTVWSVAADRSLLGTGWRNKTDALARLRELIHADASRNREEWYPEDESHIERGRE